MHSTANHFDQRARATKKVVRVVLLATSISALLLCAFASSASADATVCTPGTTAGKCERPQGIAVDNETGRLYVADRGNNRIDVFESDGTFVLAFGWGVDTGADKLEICTIASTCQAGIAGSGAGQFDKPTGIAVDNYGPPASRHDIYVGADNFRLQRFRPTGEFVQAFGEKGTGPCQFNSSNDPIAVGPNGDVYVADSFETGPHDFTKRVERFDSNGICLGEVEIFKGQAGNLSFLFIAVDSTGSFYAISTSASDTHPGMVGKYGPSGTLLYELGSDDATEADGLAVDSGDHVFVKQRGQQLTRLQTIYFITEYDSSGEIVKRFGYEVEGSLSVPGLAAYHSAGGDIFASQEGAQKEGVLRQGVKYLSIPPPGPVITPEPCKVKAGGLGNIKATLVAEVNPEGKSTTVHFEYVSQKHFEDEGFANPEETDESDPIGSDFNLYEASAQAETNPETKYHCRVIATNADGAATGEEGSFTTLAPLQFGETWPSAVGTEAATLNAAVNPLGIPTTGYFEYVEEATYLKDVAELGPGHGFDHASKTPEPTQPLDYGAGESFTARSALASGLKPGTPYRFRLAATNLYPPFEFKGPSATFRTFGSSSEALPDNRGFELVSPGQKNSADVAVPGNAAGFAEDRTIRIQAGAGSGEAVTYTSFTSFGDTESAPASSQYLSKRTAAGWTTENISPLGVSAPTTPPYSGFTADLGFAAFKINGPPLAPGCPERFRNLYVRDNATGALRCLSSEAPQGIDEGEICFTYVGSSEDGSRSFFSAPVRYAGVPAAEGTSLYESSAEGGLVPVSVLPGQSEAVAPTVGSSFGAGSLNSSDGTGQAVCQVGQTTLRHVISADGSKAFWTYVPEGAKPVTQLLVRINGTETVQLDALPAKGAGTGPAGGGVFWTASKDGSVAYFTDTARLIKGSKAEAGAPDLYRYELGEKEPLTDLTKTATDGSPANVQGVIGASDDGSYVYFVAKGVLSSEANHNGDKAQAGKPNLYLHHEGKTSFIGILAPNDPNDAADWSNQPRTLSARVSPDGHHLAFLSLESEALAGYDNTLADETITGGQHCRWETLEKKFVDSPLCAQAFLYDADSGDLTCASCNPSGSKPLGPTLLPGWTNVYEGPRYLSDDGTRLFFESFDSLSPADQNDRRDIYEFELPGAGTCSSESPAFDPVSGGCHFLISSGTSTDNSYFVDASSDGRDAFVSTRSVLSGWDVNENYDVYDARVGGGFANPVQEPVCQGEGCLPAVPVAPGSAAQSTSNTQNSGNPVQPKKRHKAKKKKRHKAKKKHGRAAQKRGARR